MDPDTAELLLESGRVQDMSTLEGRTGRKPRPKRKAKPKAKPDA